MERANVEEGENVHLGPVGTGWTFSPHSKRLGEDSFSTKKKRFARVFLPETKIADLQRQAMHTQFALALGLWLARVSRRGPATGPCNLEALMLLKERKERERERVF